MAKYLAHFRKPDGGYRYFEVHCKSRGIADKNLIDAAWGRLRKKLHVDPATPLPSWLLSKVAKV